MAAKPWMVSDELWGLIAPLLPTRERRFRYPGRRRLPDRQCLSGILYVLHTGIPWLDLPQELGFGSGMTCWRRLEEWHQAGVWDALHRLLLTKLRAADKIDLSRSIVDSSHVQAKKGAPRRARARSTAVAQAPSTTSSPTRRASRSRSSSPPPTSTTSRSFCRS